MPCVGDGVTGSPQYRDVSRRGEDLPDYGTVLFVCAMVEQPAGYNPLLAQKELLPGGMVSFEENRTLGIREDDRFRGRIPLARKVAYLRFADPLSGADEPIRAQRATLLDDDVLLPAVKADQITRWSQLARDSRPYTLGSKGGAAEGTGGTRWTAVTITGRQGGGGGIAYNLYGIA